MKKIKTTYLALIPTWWSMILMFIPTIIKAIDIYFTKYEYDETNLTAQKGFLTKKQTNVPFYRIYDITSKESVFGYGTITFHDKTKTVTIDYVYKPTEVAKELREYVNKARDKDVKVNELL